LSAAIFAMRCKTPLFYSDFVKRRDARRDAPQSLCSIRSNARTIIGVYADWPTVFAPPDRVTR